MEKSQIIFENGFYVACAMKDGSLIVQHKRRNMQGRRMIGENAQSWIQAIKDAAERKDTKEASFICKALFQS